MSQIARGSYKAAMTGGQIPKPSGIGSRELLARRLRLTLRRTDQNTSQSNVLRRNLSVVYPVLQEKTDLMLEIPQTRLAEQPTQTKTIEPYDIIIII